MIINAKSYDNNERCKTIWSSKNAGTGSTKGIDEMARKKVKEPAKEGRPTKYKPEYCQAIIDYFDVPMFDAAGKANTPPYLMNFAQSIGINTDTLYEWKAKHPEFSEAYSIAQEKQKQIVMSHALTGGYNASFAWRMMMNMFGWRERQDIDNKITLPPGLKVSFATERD